MPMKKHESSLMPISESDEPPFCLPDPLGVQPEDAIPTFEQQLAHAVMLRRWRREQGLPDACPPANSCRFRL